MVYEELAAGVELGLLSSTNQHVVTSARLLLTCWSGATETPGGREPELLQSLNLGFLY